VVFEVISGAVRRPDFGGDCTVEIGDRDFGVKDAGLLVSGATFSPALFYVGTRAERFEEAFAGIGAVWVVQKRIDD